MSNLYIHIPYCHSLCPYCDFYCSTKDRLPPASDYVDAILRELDETTGQFETVYFGGGTPTELPENELRRLLGAIQPRLRADYEWTVEANPLNFRDHLADVLVGEGVNRVSLGVQAANDAVLKKLGRTHRHQDNIRAIRELQRAGVERISGDLLFGLPDGRDEETIEFFFSEGVTHVSAYELTIEEESFWGRRGFDPTLDDVGKNERMEKIVGLLSDRGYEWYEISNFCVPGNRSRHNMNIWLGEDFVGLGAGAHGFENGVRYAYPRDAALFISTPRRVIDHETNPLLETLMSLLRLPRGVLISDLPERVRLILEEGRPTLERLVEKGYITLSQDWLASTPTGLRFLNEALLEVDRSECPREVSSV